MASRRVIHWPGIGLLALALVSFGISISDAVEWITLSRLSKDGVAVPGKVLSSTIDPTHRYTRDIINYQYQPLDGSPSRIGVECFDHAPTSPINVAELPGKIYSGEFEVLYLPSNPDISRLDISFPSRLSHYRAVCLLFLAAGVIIGGIGGFLLWRSRSNGNVS